MKAKPFTYNGVTRNLSEWADIYELPYDTLANRVRMYRAGKMPIERVLVHGKLSDPKMAYITFKGKKYTRSGLANKLGVKSSTIAGRMALIRKGKLDPEKLFAKGKIASKDRDRSSQKHYTTKDGKKVSIRELAIKAEVSFEVIKRMYDSGKSIDNIVAWIEDPYRRIRSACWINGKKQNLSDACRHLGINGASVSARVRRLGWSFQDAVSRPRVSPSERQEMVVASRIRNRRIKEIKNMGVIV